MSSLPREHYMKRAELLQDSRSLQRFEWFKARYISENPGATPEQYQRYVRELAQRLKV